MTVSETIFLILEEKNMTMGALSRKTGIGRSTIFDWKTKKTNPAADKIMVLCDVLEVTPEELLSETDTFGGMKAGGMKSEDSMLLDDYHSLSEEQKEVCRLI